MPALPRPLPRWIIWRRWLLLGTLMLSLLAAAWWYGFRDRQPVPVYVTVEPMTVNLRTPIGERYLHVALTLELQSQEQQRLVGGYLPELRHQLLTSLSALTPQQATTMQATLPEQLRQMLNQSLVRRAGEAPIRAVLFTTFLVQ